MNRMALITGISTSKIRPKGFSLIEIIVVIAVVGILSALAMSRILRSDTYNAIIVRDQVVSLSRSAQQRAIGRSNIVLSLRPAGSNLVIELEDGNGLMQSATLDLDGVTLSADVNELDSCSTTTGTTVLTTSNELVLEFDQLGGLRRGGVTGSTGYPVNVTSGARLCIDNDPAMSICWSAVGYAYPGDCIE